MALNKNNLTKKNFSNFRGDVQITGKPNIKLHDFGNDINDIVKALLIEGKLPIIPKIFFEESSLNSNISNMKNNNNKYNNNTSSVLPEYNTMNYQKNNINNEPNTPINRSNKSDIYGQDIINKYYTIKNSLNQLSIVKSFITSIIKTVKVELEKYRVSKRDYNIIKKLLIKKFESSLSETFKTQKDFCDFKQSYVEESFNIFKEFNENMPLFQYIFNNTYIGIKDTKNYFNKLFKKYTKERNILSTHIEDNFGLLAFSPLFDIDSVSEFQVASSKTDKSNIKYNNYIVYNSNNSNNSKQNLGAEFNTNGTTTIPLNEKMNEFNLMYISTYHADYYTSQHRKKINKIYSDLKESIDGLLSGSDNMTLYDIILTTLNLDFSLFELMFYYCEPILFDTAMSNHQNIKKYILDKLKTLDLYYDSYKDWLGTGIDFDKNGITDLLKFKEFFETVMADMLENVNT